MSADTKAVAVDAKRVFAMIHMDLDRALNRWLNCASGSDAQLKADLAKIADTLIKHLGSPS